LYLLVSIVFLPLLLELVVAARQVTVLHVVVVVVAL
jgi:hypothetical protein